MAEQISEGGCLCGNVRWRVTGAPSVAGYCHCRTCRKSSGAPVTAWATFPRTDFSFIAGTPAEFRSSPKVIRTFCSSCGTPMTYASAEQPDSLDLTCSSYDDPERFRPMGHSWTSHALSWFHIDDDLPRFAEAANEAPARPKKPN